MNQKCFYCLKVLGKKFIALNKCSCVYHVECLRQKILKTLQDTPILTCCNQKQFKLKDVKEIFTPEKFQELNNKQLKLYLEQIQSSQNYNFKKCDNLDCSFLWIADSKTSSNSCSICFTKEVNQSPMRTNMQKIQAENNKPIINTQLEVSILEKRKIQMDDLVMEKKLKDSCQTGVVVDQLVQFAPMTQQLNRVAMNCFNRVVPKYKMQKQLKNYCQTLVGVDYFNRTFILAPIQYQSSTNHKPEITKINRSYYPEIPLKTPLITQLFYYICNLLMLLITTILIICFFHLQKLLTLILWLQNPIIVNLKENNYLRKSIFNNIYIKIKDEKTCGILFSKFIFRLYLDQPILFSNTKFRYLSNHIDKRIQRLYDNFSSPFGKFGKQKSFFSKEEEKKIQYFLPDQNYSNV